VSERDGRRSRPCPRKHALPGYSGYFERTASKCKLIVCQVTGSASAPTFLEVTVSVDHVAAYLNQFPGSFVGSCPESGGGGGGGNNPPLNGSVTVCRVSGRGSAPILSEVLVSADQVAAYLNQNPGSFVGVCPPSDDGGHGGGTGPLNAVVTVCRVTGTVDAPRIAQLTRTTSNKQGKAKLKVKAKKKGVIPSVRPAATS
jgi:hypothetical protein